MALFPISPAGWSEEGRGKFLCSTLELALLLVLVMQSTEAKLVNCSWRSGLVETGNSDAPLLGAVEVANKHELVSTKSHEGESILSQMHCWYTKSGYCS